MSDEDAVYELTIDQPTSPKGEPLQIVGLGTFENGYTYTINKYEADMFRSFNQVQVPVLDESQAIIGSELQLGPTLLEAAKGMYGVTCTTFDKDQDKDPNSRNAKRAVTTFSADTSNPNPNSALAESETPSMNLVSTDQQPNQAKEKVQPTQPATTSENTKAVANPAKDKDKGGDS